MPVTFSKNLENRCLFSPLASLTDHVSYSLFQVSVPTSRKPQYQLYDLATAWDALYYTRYPAEGGGSEMVKGLLEARVDQTKQQSLPLPASSVTLLDVMAEAAGLPRKRGEATIDLTPFTHAADTPHAQPRENTSIPRRPLR